MTHTRDNKGNEACLKGQGNFTLARAGSNPAPAIKLIHPIITSDRTAGYQGTPSDGPFVYAAALQRQGYAPFILCRRERRFQ